VLVINYFVNLAHRQGVCKELTSTFLNNGNVHVIVESKKFQETYVTTQTTSQCKQFIGSRNEEIIICNGEIKKDSTNLKAPCSQSQIEIINDSNELTNSFSLSIINWAEDSSKSCKNSFARAQSEGKLSINQLVHCNF
jgi:hypothetical protein